MNDENIKKYSARGFARVVPTSNLVEKYIHILLVYVSIQVILDWAISYIIAV